MTVPSITVSSVTPPTHPIPLNSWFDSALLLKLPHTGPLTVGCSNLSMNHRHLPKVSEIKENREERENIKHVSAKYERLRKVVFFTLDSEALRVNDKET